MFAMLGAAAGVLASLPLLLILRALPSATAGDGPGFARVVGSALAPFLLLQLLMLAVWLRWPSEVLPFGAFAAFAFLLASTAAGLAAWRRM